jgi:spore germination protein GerM
MKILKMCCSLSLVFILGSTMLTGCSNKDKISKNNKEKIENIQMPLDKDNFIDLAIYFDSSKQEGKAGIKMEESLINKEELIGEVIVNKLIKGPSIKSQLDAILPSDTRLLSFSIKDGIAIVNLSKEAVVPMTETKEEACLKSIAASLTQLPSVNEVKLLIESQDVDTLGGNFNISDKFNKDTLTRKK